MANNNHYDVIIIGTGAGGGTLAYKLAPSGKKILLLERGDYVPREKDNWSTRAVNLEGKYNTKRRGETQTARSCILTRTITSVATQNFTAQLYSVCAKKTSAKFVITVVSRQPGRSAMTNWSPYYTEAEHLYQVHGNRGEDPTEPWANAPYKYPAVTHETRIQHLHDDLERAGLTPFHVPLGIRIDETNPQKSPCIRCNTCDGHPCLIGAKSDAQTICVDPALQYGNVSLITNAKVMRLETNGDARQVSKVIVELESAREEYSGDIVVASCGAVNSAALLLRSANDSHPNGLANGSDVVGRHYMGHINSVLMALSKCPNPTIFQKTLAINDFYLGSKDWDYPMGHISFVGKLDADTLKAGAPAIAPGWTLDLMAKHSLDFWLTSEDLPDPDNRVTVDRDGQIHVSYKLNNIEGHDRLKAQLQKAMKQTNCDIHGHDCHQGLFAQPKRAAVMGAGTIGLLVTGGDRKIEVPADKINLQFVLGNKVMVGTVNANREYFEMGVKDLAQAEAEYPGWLTRLLTNPGKGLENYRQLFDKLLNPNGAIKVFCEVAPL